jgi:hypothetical protein
LSKRDLFKEAKTAGLVAEGATADDYTEHALLTLLGRAPAWEGSLSSSEPLVGADGHETLSKADLEARQ